MARIYSFPPTADVNAKILILGSMPGRASLAADESYAHPQNSFWRIMSHLLQFDASCPYPARIQAIESARVAIWDVLHSCVREGSLDSSIERDTLMANDFRSFFATHKQITHVFFNGAKAESLFKKYVLGGIDTSTLSLKRLPSTSPANASATFANKLKEWEQILAALKAV